MRQCERKTSRAAEQRRASSRNSVLDGNLGRVESIYLSDAPPCPHPRAATPSVFVPTAGHATANLHTETYSIGGRYHIDVGRLQPCANGPVGFADFNFPPN